jgi:hypothetical protein
VIVIVASRFDASARQLNDRWADEGCCLLTPADLSVSGWRYRVGDPLNSVAIIGGRTVKQFEIHAVFTRLQWVWETELLDIVPGDRGYIASEMSAFLLCWLTGLTCPVLNRPSASCLTGPGWSREQWNSAALEAGMRVDPIRRLSSLSLAAGLNGKSPNDPKQVSLTIAGGVCVGCADTTLAEQAINLSRVAKTDFLTVRFSSAEPTASFVGVNVFPNIEESSIAEAALNYLSRRSDS